MEPPPGGSSFSRTTSAEGNAIINQRIVLLSLATFGAVGMALSFAIGQLDEVKPIPAPDVDGGALLYAENCASCHGANLEGAEDWRERGSDGRLKPPPHDAKGHTWHHTDTQIFTYTKLGGVGAMAKNGVKDFNSGMPAFAELLTDEEIWSVLNFIKSTWPEKIRDAQEDISRQNPE